MGKATVRSGSADSAYTQNFLPSSVISRPLQGEAPTIDLVLGYSRTNTSPVLKLVLLAKSAVLTSDSKHKQSRPGR